MPRRECKPAMCSATSSSYCSCADPSVPLTCDRGHPAPTVPGTQLPARLPASVQPAACRQPLKRPSWWCTAKAPSHSRRKGKTACLCLRSWPLLKARMALPKLRAAGAAPTSKLMLSLFAAYTISSCLPLSVLLPPPNVAVVVVVVVGRPSTCFSGAARDDGEARFASPASARGMCPGVCCFSFFHFHFSWPVRVACLVALAGRACAA